MDLLEAFRERTKHLQGNDQKFLLAVSGGMDSMCLLDLCIRSKIEVEVAHCNFGLRGEESELDEVFVVEHCKQRDILVHTKRSKLLGEANIQEKARDHRYQWFRELGAERGLQGIMTAHHADDQIETFFIDLLRGAGLRGLSAMEEMSNGIHRPLLFARRADIEEYAQKYDLEYRTDSSNASRKYLRNQVRLDLIPVIENIRPGASKVVLRTIENLRAQLHDLEHYYEGLGTKILVKNGDDLYIRNVEELKGKVGFLEHVLHKYGFTRDTVLKVSDEKRPEVGKQYFSSSYILTVDREAMIISPRSEGITKEAWIESDARSISTPVHLEFEILPNADLDPIKDAECFDLDKLQFPLHLRKWADGDRLVPLGMQGSKLVSDLLIDSKTPRPEKDRVFVLCSNDEIIWVLGRRISEKVKITPLTKTVLRIRRG